MNRLISCVILALLPGVAMPADTLESAEPGVIESTLGYELSDFLWHFRPIVVFADTEADPRFSEQMERLRAEIDLLAERDVLILTDTDPALSSDIRKQLRPRGFQFVLIGKDGRVLMRRPSPQSVREITRSIDKSPTRQREIRERRGNGS
ncbi:MAG: DUF4174 domain-containing protein [Paracoccaceae bacterium]